MVRHRNPSSKSANDAALLVLCMVAALFSDCFMQEPTQRSFHELLQQLKKDNRHNMTVLLLGEDQPCCLVNDSCCNRRCQHMHSTATHAYQIATEACELVSNMLCMLHKLVDGMCRQKHDGQDFHRKLLVQRVCSTNSVLSARNNAATDVQAHSCGL